MAFGVALTLELVLFPVDFEQPRALWGKVWNDQQREAYVQNVAVHFGNVKSKEVIARQRTRLFVPYFPSYSNRPAVVITVSVWATVDQGLSDRIANAIGAPKAQPLNVKPAAQAVRYRANLGFAFSYPGRL